MVTLCKFYSNLSITPALDVADFVRGLGQVNSGSTVLCLLPIPHSHRECMHPRAVHRNPIYQHLSRERS